MVEPNAAPDRTGILVFRGILSLLLARLVSFGVRRRRQREQVRPEGTCR